jgi:hypothetical protein
MATLEISVQLSLIGLDNLDILGLETELATAKMVFQRRCLDGSLLLRILKRDALSTKTHLGGLLPTPRRDIVVSGIERYLWSRADILGRIV